MKLNIAKQNIIPIFFTADDNYVPYLCVAIKSITDNCHPVFHYKVHILTNGLTKENMKKVKTFENENLTIEFNNVTKTITKIKAFLNENLRDYYTDAIFYRIFIPKMFPQYHRAIYIDCDVVVLGDISRLFFTDLKGNYLGSVPDEVVPTHPFLIKYVEQVIGVKLNHYFCSGVILFDLDAMRKHKVEQKFIGLLSNYNFDTIAPDQDYLNVICKDHVFYLHPGWDKQANNTKYNDKIFLVHYNMFCKPWLYEKVPYEDYFWQYAKETPFYDEMLKTRAEYSDEQKKADTLAKQRMIEISNEIAKQEKTFKKVLANTSIENAIAKATESKATKTVKITTKGKQTK